MSLPASATRLFQGVNTTFRISGATYASISDVRFRYGNTLNEEHVTGTDIPFIGTGGFHGEIEATMLGASDHRIEGLADASSGIITTFGMTWIEGDTQATASTRTWTLSGKFTEYEKLTEKDGFVRYRIRGILTNRPTVA